MGRSSRRLDPCVRNVWGLTRRRALDEPVCEFLRRLRGEKRRVCVRQLLRLPRDRVDHALIAVAKARNGGTAAGVDVALAGRVDNFDAVAGNCNRQ